MDTIIQLCSFGRLTTQMARFSAEVQQKQNFNQNFVFALLIIIHFSSCSLLPL